MERRKRIKVLNVITGLGTGGAERLLLSILRKLNGNKFDSVVVSLYQDDDYMDEFLKAGVKVYKIGYRQKLNPCIVWKIVSIIRREKPDIIHTHLPHATIWGRMAAALSGCRVVLTTEHNTCVWKRSRGAFYILYKLTYRRNGAIIAISHAVKNEMIRRFGIPEGYIQVIYNGVELNALKGKSEIPEELDGIGHPIIGTVGRLHRVKGHEYLIEAFGKIQKRYANANLVIVGDGREKSRLKWLSQELGLQGSVHFLGTKKNIYGILSMMDIFVFPSLQEGLGIALIEACAAGKPCVASKIGGIPEVTEDGVTGFLVPPGDDTAIAEKVIELLEDEEKAKGMGNSARSFCRQQFNIERKVEALQSLYIRSILNRKKIARWIFSKKLP
jgi:N-acetyl-alpha-D-glucosaminyl L-malate synthase BshA